MNGAGRYSGGSFAGRSGYSGNNFSGGSVASRGYSGGSYGGFSGGGWRLPGGGFTEAAFPELHTEAAFLEVASRVEADMVVDGIKRHDRIMTGQNH